MKTNKTLLLFVLVLSFILVGISVTALVLIAQQKGILDGFNWGNTTVVPTVTAGPTVTPTPSEQIVRIENEDSSSAIELSFPSEWELEEEVLPKGKIIKYGGVELTVTSFDLKYTGSNSGVGGFPEGVPIDSRFDRVFEKTEAGFDYYFYGEKIDITMDNYLCRGKQAFCYVKGFDPDRYSPSNMWNVNLKVADNAAELVLNTFDNAVASSNVVITLDITYRGIDQMSRYDYINYSDYDDNSYYYFSDIPEVTDPNVQMMGEVYLLSIDLGNRYYNFTTTDIDKKFIIECQSHRIAESFPAIYKIYSIKSIEPK